MTKAWICLLIAGLLEIAWAVGMKYTHHFTKPGPTVFTVVTMILSFVFLERAIRTLPLGTGYAIWTGIGVAGTTLFGIFVLHESATASRLFFLALILTGILGLKWTTVA